MPTLQKRIDALARSPRHPDIALSLYRASDGFSFDGGAGALGPDAPFFIASTTKLFVSALIFALEDAGRLELDDPLARHLPEADLAGLHVRKGRDATTALTLRHLLDHSSGLPDYFQQRMPGGPLLARLKRGEDTGWRYDDTLEWSRQMGARFAPGGRRAHYADTNYQLLGCVVEGHHDAPLAAVIRDRICAPLGLERTWMYTDPTDDRPLPLRCADRPLDVPEAMASFGPDGGVVSTARELLAFVRAWFDGALFEPARLPSLETWRRVMWPLEAGVGLLRMRLPRLLSLGRRLPVLHGHSGLSGAFAFYAPERGVYLAGTVNQIESPGTSFRLMYQTLLGLPPLNR